jgi:glycosyltransferase involved in cell wall biosynthesis
MRIALLTEVFLPKIDGITNRLAHTVRCLTGAGHQVLLFAPSGSVGEHAGARVVRVPAAPFPRYPELRVALPDPRLALELARFRPHIVHAVGPVCLGVWGIAAARALGLSVVASYHTDLERYAALHGLAPVTPLVWPFVRAVHGAALLNLCPSQATRAQLEAHGVRDVGLWRGGVDAELFHPRRRSIRTRWELSGGRLDAPILLYVGRLSAEKGLERLEPLLDALPQVRLALVGDGPARAHLVRRFAGRPVVFTGYLRGEALARAYASADVFVLPSTTETLGFVVLEAMSAGCPVIAAAAGGVVDLIEHEQTGLLYDPADPAQLVDGVHRLLEQRDLARALAQRGRKLAAGASWSAQTTQLIEFYARAIRTRRRRSWVGRLLGCQPAGA